MSNKTEITVILPVHEINDELKPLFSNAIQSIVSQVVKPDEVIIVRGKNTNLRHFIDSFNYSGLSVRILENTGDTDFCSQVNFAINEVKTKYFSLLELDDEYSKIWVKNAVKYMEAYPNMDIFLPIIVDVNDSGEFIGLTNEAILAAEFSDELGVLDNGTLLRYQNFNTDGMVMKVEKFKEFGGFKPSIKLTFIYEFFLRMTYNDVKIMTIPKIGYKHVNQRKDSLFYNYRSELTPDEARWWMNLAKKEYFFTKDRNIKYEPLEPIVNQ